MTVKKIDLHLHCFHLESLMGFRNTPDMVRAMYDELNIEKGVFLATNASPECSTDTISSREVLDMVRSFPETIGWWFCSIDPRNGKNSPDTDFEPLIRRYKKLGAKGIGETSANIPLDDPRFLNLFRHGAAQNMPVLLHIGVANKGYGVVDELHLPRLQHVLHEVPDIRLIGHSPQWWNEIGDNVTEENREGYVTGKIEKEGVLWRIMRENPNMYCDISANSAYIALTRDRDKGYQFLNEFHDRIYFGTDLMAAFYQKCPHKVMGAYLDESYEKGYLSEDAYLNICRRNALRLLEETEE